ncbi:MAG: Crp/Fnr family transcriptional regulator [Bdellovibrio sp.]
MSTAKKIEAGQYLFREGDPPDAVYVVKHGQLAVVKSKAGSEITLAEVGAGSMVGEMAFFDQQPRSASIKALKETEVILLPFKALHIQFQGFPEWAKVLMKQVSKNLRLANQRIRQLEKTGPEEDFSPHLLSKLLTILCLVSQKYGQDEDNRLQIPPSILRNMTIRVFQEAPSKMQQLLQALQELGYVRIEEIGVAEDEKNEEEAQEIEILALDRLFEFSEWWNEFLFKKENLQIRISAKDLRTLQALAHFSEGSEVNHQGSVHVDLTSILEKCEAQLGFMLKMEDFEILIEKGLLSEKTMKESTIESSFFREDLEHSIRVWTLQHDLMSLLNPKKNEDL